MIGNFIIVGCDDQPDVRLFPYRDARHCDRTMQQADTGDQTQGLTGQAGRSRPRGNGDDYAQTTPA